MRADKRSLTGSSMSVGQGLLQVMDDLPGGLAPDLLDEDIAQVLAGTGTVTVEHTERRR